MTLLQTIEKNHTFIRENIKSIVQDRNITEDELARFTYDDFKKILQLYSKYTDTNWSDKITYEKEFVKLYLANQQVPISEKIAILFDDISTFGEYGTISNLTPYADFIISFMNSKVDDIATNRRETSIISIVKALNAEKIKFTLNHIKKLNYDIINYIIDSYASNSIFRGLTDKKKNKFVPKVEKEKKKDNHEDNEIYKSNNTNEYTDKCTNENADHDTDHDTDNDTDDDTDYDRYDTYKPYYSSRYDMSSIHMFIIHACMITSHIPDSWYKALVQSAHRKLQLFPMRITTFKGELLSQLQTHYENAMISPVIEHLRTPGILLNNSNSKFYSYTDFKKMNSCYCNSITFELPYMSYGYISHVEIDVYDKEPTKIYLTNGKDYYNLEKFKKCDFYGYSYEREVKTIRKENANYGDVCKYISVSFDITEYINIKDIRFYGEAISFV